MTRHVILYRVFTALVAAFLFLAPGVVPAVAAVCMDHKTLTDYLSEKFKEQPKAVGLVAAAGLMSVYVSPKGTWTILMTNPQGVACIVAAGDGYETFEPDLPQDPEF